MELKRNTLFISFILVFCINLNAQSDLGYAPVGAKWHYLSNIQTLGGGSRTGHMLYEVVKDTIINGKLSKEISISGNQVLQTIGLTNPFYLHYDSNRVYWLNGMTNVFDLLYDFNAVVGDSWTVKLQCDSSYYPWFNGDSVIYTVDSVYFDSINGVPIKHLITSIYPNLINQSTNIRIDEYIGGISTPFPHNANCGPSGIHTWISELICYEDVKFGIYMRRNLCAVPISSLEEELNKSQISISPNPANYNITIESNQMMKEATISNLAGEVLAIQKSENTIFDFNTSNIPNGLHFISITFENGSRRIDKVIIQR